MIAAIGTFISQMNIAFFGNITFAASVGADDGGDTFFKIQPRFVGERFEAAHFKRFEMQMVHFLFLVLIYR